ncbi:hypothetical protein CC1G_12065 [Coprinopsis cinerea okayama7|uniref:DNA 3'-5' helicase n=1 Tax=Coprinopsis cinerea (strain Okayama-7 / 130 / ATCC MYA-4618 / FGSC 9003) TaxID=240176 RepID=A8N0D4_COPC7|nr:hypothetical protein CC1G_12065 [Coprinopsis cinerea okayama7\|eukprot:XP_001828335.1 hypothetical protein CC1G_12065 [Coprinopsis cinerea okayama7\
MGVYNSPEGHLLVKQILGQNQPPIVPHDYQTEGVCACLDGESLLATLPTGAGKTSYYSFTMLVMIALSKAPELALEGKGFPKNPAMLVILPTKALQEDMRKGLTKLGLDAVVINGDTVADASKQRVDLWKECQKKHSMILISPEELISNAFRTLLASPDFAARLCRYGIDEAHLIVNWGKTGFRNAFMELGHMRSRLPLVNNHLMPVIVTSATIRPGEPMDTICNVLGLTAGDYHLIRRSNLRPDIKIIIRELSSSLSGLSFPELDWILEQNNTVIFCRTIGIGFRVAAYLWRTAITKRLPRLGFWFSQLTDRRDFRFPVDCGGWPHPE